jgi:hypothetical protein
MISETKKSTKKAHDVPKTKPYKERDEFVCDHIGKWLDRLKTDKNSRIPPCIRFVARDQDMVKLKIRKGRSTAPRQMKEETREKSEEKTLRHTRSVTNSKQKEKKFRQRIKQYSQHKRGTKMTIKDDIRNGKENKQQKQKMFRTCIFLVRFGLKLSKSCFQPVWT